MDIEKLNEAIRNIKEFCEAFPDCQICPFYEDECILADVPCKWEVLDGKTD